MARTRGYERIVSVRRANSRPTTPRSPTRPLSARANASSANWEREKYEQADATGCCSLHLVLEGGWTDEGAPPRVGLSIRWVDDPRTQDEELAEERYVCKITISEDGTALVKVRCAAAVARSTPHTELEGDDEDEAWEAHKQSAYSRIYASLQENDALLERLQLRHSV